MSENTQRFVYQSDRECTCTVCDGVIPAWSWHFRKHYRDGNWSKMVKICQTCLNDITHAVVARNDTIDEKWNLSQSMM